MHCQFLHFYIKIFNNFPRSNFCFSYIVLQWCLSFSLCLYSLSNKKKQTKNHNLQNHCHIKCLWPNVLSTKWHLFSFVTEKVKGNTMTWPCWITWLKVSENYHKSAWSTGLGPSSALGGVLLAFTPLSAFTQIIIWMIKLIN